ncbi:MAG: bifunctional 2-C-methyl-D-erythritol 4-phosphate cytidylyltransferase/2-C-methyl-D-erythritol 2,4-cyclodiphosphate synthase [Rhodobacteraceae bacterium]|nr:bifunctional 2-C-methyl-D-erythritol 4-phosphate cytidylyltransferase/2-C-methyl-D-erythritol 2,4-cyclodiphosphate synthase [Paracoccaceae bacterium]
MDTAIILVAAGRGSRAGGGVPKQWRPLGGMPLALHSARTLAPLGRLVASVHPDDFAVASGVFAGGATLVAGGETRAASVRNALELLDGGDVQHVLIHDAARPFVTLALAQRVLAALDRAPGAAPAVAVTDALWRGEDGRVKAAVPRAGLLRAQTPQGFRFPDILAAHRGFRGEAADDVEIALAAGLDVEIVDGEESNFKVTFPEDFARGERQIGMSDGIRVGQGYDVHAFTQGDHVMLCGVRVPHDRGLLGHSDADVGMHALTDAIYGALADGDIGRHFPPSDMQWKGAPSETFLAHAAGRARDRGFRVGNADVTIVCERPKIGPHATEMARELGRIIGVDPMRVSVKATTSEGLGFTGRGEGIAAMAIVTLVRP